MSDSRDPSHGAAAGSGASAVIEAPRRSPWAIILPVAVIAGTAALLAVSAQDVLRPATPVRVHQVMFDRGSAAPPTAASVTPDGSTAAPSPASPPSVTPAADAARPPVDARARRVQAAGWLEADPYFVACTGLADGIVASLHVLEGDPVEAGQVVARLVDDDARLALARAEAALETAEAGHATAVARQRGAADVLTHLIDREQAAGIARARLAESRAELDRLPSLVAVEVARRDELAEEVQRVVSAQQAGAVNEFERIVIEKQLAAQSARVVALQARDAVLAAAIQRQEADLQAAERHLELRIEEREALDVATAAVRRAEAMIRQRTVEMDEARLRLDRMTITAPIDGIVQRRLKTVGDKLMLGMDSPHSAHVVHLYDPKNIQVRVDVPLADASGVVVGQTCEIVVEILPDVTFRGEVTRVVHEADLQKNTLQAKVRVIDPSPLLRPEMLTRVTFLPAGERASPGARDARGASRAVPGASAPASSAAGTRAGSAATSTASTASDRPIATVLVPRDGLTEDGTLWLVVDRVGRRGTARRVSVDVVASFERDDAWVRVRGPLAPGDLIIDRAGERSGLTTGDTVRVLGPADAGAQVAMSPRRRGGAA